MTLTDQVPDEYRHWKPEAQSKLLAMLQMGAVRRYRPFYCPNPGCNGQPHAWPTDERECPRPYGHEWKRDEDSDEIIVNGLGLGACLHCGVKGLVLDEWTFPHSRVDQRPPRWNGDWATLFVRSGRGAGKTKMGSEITNKVALAGKVPRVTLIAATGPDLRATMVEGDSGILACSPPDKKPVWEPSKKQLTWPNGAIALGYSAEEPDRLRGQNSGYVWGDEPAHWALVEECWENMLYGLRKGQHPKIVATSTPKSTKWVKKQVADALTIDRRVSSWVNLTNLSNFYQRLVLDPKKGTRMGRQELEGEILADVEGALWNWEMIRSIDPDEVPNLVTIVVSIDPAGTANKRSDETGIVVIGIDADKNLYVLADLSGKYSPEGWAKKALTAAVNFSADRVVFEKNYGGDMVRRVLDAEVASRGAGYIAPRFVEVTSRRGKELRAEPIVAVYEKKRVFHVGERGTLEKLEDEQTSWVPGVGASPNRVDALVHGATNLLGTGGSWAAAIPADM
jgi:phage terminase large subunit-like protein